MISTESVSDLNSPEIIPRLDPVTTGILIEIGIGIATKLGVAALSSLFGLGSRPVDLQAILQDLLTNVAAVVRQSIEENEVKQANSRMKGLVVLMREYNNSPTTSSGNVKSVITESAMLLGQLSEMMPLASSFYLFGVMVRISALQEYAKITNEPGEYKNARDYACDAVPLMKTAIQNLQGLNDKRVSPVSVVTGFYDPNHLVNEPLQDLRGHDGLPVIPTAQASYSVDGARKAFDTQGRTCTERARNAADAARNADLEAIRSEFNTRCSLPMLKALASVEAIANDQ